MSYDIYIEPLNNGESYAVVSQGGDSGKIFTFGDYARHVGIQGPYKMVNRFMKCLFTPVGTDISDLEYGTQLAGAISTNVDSAILKQLVTTAVMDAENKIKEYDSEYGYPDEERLFSAEILEISIVDDGSGVEFKVQVTNVAGVVMTMSIPTFIRST